MIRNAALAASVAAEALALYVVAEWIASGYDNARGTVPAVLFVLVALAAFGLPILIDELDLSARIGGVVIGVAAYVLIYGSLRIAFFGDVALWNLSWAADFLGDAEGTLREGAYTLGPTILLVTAWARSAYRANNDIELETLPRSVGLPFVIVTGIVILAAASDRSGEVARGAISFYAVAVIALACSQLALSGTTFGELRAGGITATLLGGTVVATLACVVVFGIVFGLLAGTLGPFLGRVVEVVLTIVLTPPAWLIEKIMRALLSGSSFPELAQDIQQQAQQAGGSTQDDPSVAQQTGTFLLRMLGLVIALGIVALVIAWFSRLRRRIRSREDEPPAVAVAGSLAEDAAAFWRSLFHRGGRQQQPPRGRTPAEQLYHEVLATAERQGHPRPPGDTPEEFAPRLRDAFRTPITDDITRAFEHSRYAGRPPSDAEVADLARRWRTTPR